MCFCINSKFPIIKSGGGGGRQAERKEERGKRRREKKSLIFHVSFLEDDFWELI